MPFDIIKSGKVDYQELITCGMFAIATEEK
jgi:hypothetical protein